MSTEQVRARQSGEEIRGFIESQGIITKRDGHKVTLDIDDLVGAALVLCAYERALEMKSDTRAIADAAREWRNALFNDDDRLTQKRKAIEARRKLFAALDKAGQ
jgi:hypothetical protein